ncbi:hypothetical protein D3C84_723350 [compost metagenome]
MRNRSTITPRTFSACSAPCLNAINWTCAWSMWVAAWVSSTTKTKQSSILPSSNSCLRRCSMISISNSRVRASSLSRGASLPASAVPCWSRSTISRKTTARPLPSPMAAPIATVLQRAAVRCSSATSVSSRPPAITVRRCANTISPDRSVVPMTCSGAMCAWKPCMKAMFWP